MQYYSPALQITSQHNQWYWWLYDSIGQEQLKSDCINVPSQEKTRIGMSEKVVKQ